MTYTIHRYPAELIDVVHLVDGRRITVRPVLPQDADILQAFVRGLSDESRRNRFFRTLHELPGDLLARFTQVDYRRHVALVAEVFDQGVETIVGEARYVVEDDESAEFAVAVADLWQGRGIGALLLQRLSDQATAAGLPLLYGRTLCSNRAMHRLARKAGFTVALDPEDEDLLLLRKCLDLTPGAMDRPDRAQSPLQPG
jgi:GNAT superfamily N-acetyltransferase